MISQEQKNKLRKFMGKDLFEANDKRDIKDVKDAVGKTHDNLSKSMTEGLKALEKKIAKIQPTDMTPVIEALNKFADTVVKNHKPMDMSGFFKDFAIQIAQTGSSTKNTEELIRNLKWNSTMGIKNRSGTPVNPSTDGADSIGNGTLTVTTSGTAVQLPSNPCKKVFIQCTQSNASLTNNGVIIVGAQNVLYSSHNGLELFPTQSQVFDVNNTNLIWVDASDNGSKIQYTFEAAGTL